jgi:uncharacterized protein YciI
MEFLCYHRDRTGSDPVRDAFVEAHWSYMDRFAEQMVARGPTLTEDGEFATGSIHVLNLPGPAEARAFAFDEPNYQAGVYRDVLLRRWSNRLGRTMWQFPGDRGRCFMVLGFGGPRSVDDAPDATLPADTDDLIVYGPLLADDGTTWLGTAALLRAADAVAACRVLTESAYAHVEVQPWQFGGRPE